MEQGFRLCIEPREIYDRGLTIAFRKLEVKADGLRKLEGNRLGCAMASVQFTTGVLGQGMHSQGVMWELGRANCLHVQITVWNTVTQIPGI